jgi:hypothetical protein
MLFHTVLLALTATIVGAVPSLEIDGPNFINPETGKKFEIVGMAYQPGGSAGYDPETGEDPLSHADRCLRDAAVMQILGVNTIRVYNLDPNINHDECASIFNAAGMYMLIDVNSPLVGEAITSFEPWTSYYMEYLNRTFAVVEAFSNYPNTLAFFSGNEVIDTIETAEFVPPYLRAVTRDMKNYIKNNIDRKIPVGYSAADVRDVLWDTYNYVTCARDGDADDMSRADFFALNSYSWCGIEATFETSTFDDLVEGFKDNAVPVFFSEYGCNETPERWWNETESIYGPDMYDVFSGGVVYEWTQEDNDYGLVEIDGDETSILSDYNRLKDKLTLIDWETIQFRDPVQGGDLKECSPDLIEEDGFNNNFTLPAVPPGAQELIDDGIDPKPQGQLVDISDFAVTLSVTDNQDNALNNLEVMPIPDDEFNWTGKNEAETGDSEPDPSEDDNNDEDDTSDDNSDNTDSSDDEDGAMLMMPALWAAALPLVAVLLA